MRDYDIQEVDGLLNQEVIEEFNKLVEDWPALEARHFSDGYWWFAYRDGMPIAMAGLVPFEPFPFCGYLKRCYVMDRGHGLQYRFMMVREAKAKQLGWTHLMSECREDNIWSASNFRKAGFEPTEPEQRWGDCPRESVYWVKRIV